MPGLPQVTKSESKTEMLPWEPTDMGNLIPVLLAQFLCAWGVDPVTFTECTITAGSVQPLMFRGCGCSQTLKKWCWSAGTVPLTLPSFPSSPSLCFSLSLLVFCRHCHTASLCKVPSPFPQSPQSCPYTTILILLRQC